IFFDPNSIFSGQFIGSPSMNFVDLIPVAGGFTLGESPIVLPASAVPEGVRKSASPVRMGVRPRDLQLVDEVPPLGIEVPIEDVFSVGRERFFTFPIGTDIAQGIDVRS